MRCKIAAAFGKFPYEVSALPLSEYKMCRDYVLAVDDEMRRANQPPEDEMETWGNEAVAKAPWDADVVTAME